MREFRDRFEHHLLLKMADEGIEEAQSYLRSTFPSRQGDFFECTERESRKAFLHRFVVAGAAVRYRDLHADHVEDVVALDVALRRNDPDWFEATRTTRRGDSPARLLRSFLLPRFSPGLRGTQGA